EGSLSEQHQVLPKTSGFVQIAKLLPDGWGANFGMRRSEYTTSGVNTLVAGAERYWGDWRAAYTLYSGRPDGGPSAETHRLQLTRFYGDRSSVGLSYSFGREIENVGP